MWVMSKIFLSLLFLTWGYCCWSPEFWWSPSISNNNNNIKKYVTCVFRRKNLFYSYYYHSLLPSTQPKVKRRKSKSCDWRTLSRCGLFECVGETQKKKKNKNRTLLSSLSPQIKKRARMKNPCLKDRQDQESSRKRERKKLLMILMERRQKR